MRGYTDTERKIITWWRAKDYRVDGGRLRPVGPIEAYDASVNTSLSGEPLSFKQNGYRRAAPPYALLLDLANEAKEIGEVKDGLSFEAWSSRRSIAVRRFAKRAGLLSDQLLDVDQVWLGKEEADAAASTAYGEAYRNFRINFDAGVVRYSRINNAWGIHHSDPLNSPRNLPLIEYSPRHRQQVERSIGGQEYSVDSRLAWLIGIDPLPRPTPYPMPCSETWWGLYCESVDILYSRATSFAEAAEQQDIRALEDWAQGVSIRFEHPAEIARLPLPKRLKKITEQTEAPTVFEYWASTSLLSVYALMVLRDLGSASRWVKKCEACKHWFVTGRANQLRCPGPVGQGSDGQEKRMRSSCTNTVRKRRQRENKREALKRNE